MRSAPEGAEIQLGITTFVGRSHTEIARLIAFDHGWKLYGDQIIDDDDVVITNTLEEAAAKMLALGWFDPRGAAINCQDFGGTKTTNAANLRST